MKKKIIDHFTKQKLRVGYLHLLPPSFRFRTEAHGRFEYITTTYTLTYMETHHVAFKFDSVDGSGLLVGRLYDLNKSYHLPLTVYIERDIVEGATFFNNLAEDFKTLPFVRVIAWVFNTVRGKR